MSGSKGENMKLNDTIRLQVENYRLYLANIMLMRGIQGVVAEACVNYENLLIAQNLLAQGLDSFEAPTVTQVRGALIVREAESNNLHVTVTADRPFLGTAAEAEIELFGGIMAAIWDLPTPNEVGEQTIDYVSRARIYELLAALSKARAEGRFDAAKAAERSRLWTEIESQHPDAIRHVFTDKYNKLISRTFGRLEASQLRFVGGE